MRGGTINMKNTKRIFLILLILINVCLLISCYPTKYSITSYAKTQINKETKIPVNNIQILSVEKRAKNQWMVYFNKKGEALEGKGYRIFIYYENNKLNEDFPRY